MNLRLSALAIGFLLTANILAFATPITLPPAGPPVYTSLSNGFTLSETGYALINGAACTAAVASADTSGCLRSASVTFQELSSSPGNLTVTLTNTASWDAKDPTDILTGVFFDVAGNLSTLDPESALIPSGSALYLANNNTALSYTDVSGAWAYKWSSTPERPSPAVGAAGGPTQGIGSSGYSSGGTDPGVFGSQDLFGSALAPNPGSNSDPQPDGIGYGIASTGDNIATGNGGLSGRYLTKDTVVFTLSGWTLGTPTYDQFRSVAGCGANQACDTVGAGNIGNIFLQYGTGLDEPYLWPPVVTNNDVPDAPEPGSILLLGTGMAGLARFLRRRKVS